MQEETLKMILSMVNQFILPMAEKYVEESPNVYDNMALKFVRGGLNEILKDLDTFSEAKKIQQKGF